jgi:putative Mg2+ transporter-C (MgtC) family protein
MILPFDLLLLGRVALAAGLGFLVGWERKASGSPARGQAVGLTSLSAAALTSLALELFPTTAHQMIAAVITGSGFLGAGVIIHADRGQVHGLTTAAGLWAMVVVGVVVGAGHELLGVVLALLVYLILAWDSWPLVSRLRQHRGGQPAAQADSQPQVEAASDGAMGQPEPAPPHRAVPPAPVPTPPADRRG